MNWYCYFIVDFLFEKQVNEWLSKFSIKSYKSSFNTFLKYWIINIEDKETLTEKNFKIFLWEMLLKYNWSSHTYNRTKKNLKVFFDYLIRIWYIQNNPLINIKLRKLEKTLPKYFNKTQVLELRKLINSKYSWSDYLSLRNNTILYTFLFTWIRLNELITLKISDLDFLSWIINIQHWKGNKQRLVPMVDFLQKKLIDYINQKKLYCDNDLLFATRYGWIMQHRDIYTFIKVIQKEVSYKITPHMFRHTFATELVRKNINLYNISKILWHSRLETTKIYLNLDLSSIKETLNLSNLYF